MMDRIYEYINITKNTNALRLVISLPFFLISVLLDIISFLIYWLSQKIDRLDEWFWNDVLFKIRWGG